MACRMLLVATLILGVIYPLLVTGVSQLFFSSNANGSLVKDGDGQVRGSKLLAQAFVDAQGQPLAQYFQPRPSSAADGWDAMKSGGSNLGPNSPEFVEILEQRKQELATFNGHDQATIPADALTSSASGLDPLISWENLQYQLDRVAQARGLAAVDVEDLARAHIVAINPATSAEDLVNVTTLNLALDALRS